MWNVLTLHRLLRHEGTLLWSHGLTLLGEFLHYAALVALDLAQHRVAHAAFPITIERSVCHDQALLKARAFHNYGHDVRAIGERPGIDGEGTLVDLAERFAAVYLA